MLGLHAISAAAISGLGDERALVLIAEPAAYALDVASPLFSGKRIFSGLPVSYSLTGSVLGEKQTHVLNTVPAAFALVAPPAATVQAWTLFAAAAAFAADGVDAATVRGFPLAALPAAFGWTSTSAALLRGIVCNAVSPSYMVGTPLNALIRDALIGLEPGYLVVSPFAASAVAARSLAALNVHLAVAGGPLTALFGRCARLEPAEFRLEGNAGLHTGRVLNVSQVTYTWDTSAAGSSLTRSLAAAYAGYAWNPAAAGASARARVLPGLPATLVLSTAPADLVRGYAALLTPAGFAVDCLPAGYSRSWTLDTELAEYRIGLAPTYQPQLGVSCKLRVSSELVYAVIIDTELVATIEVDTMPVSESSPSIDSALVYRLEVDTTLVAGIEADTTLVAGIELETFP